MRDHFTLAEGEHRHQCFFASDFTEDIKPTSFSISTQRAACLPEHQTPRGLRPLSAPSSNRAGSEDPWKGLSPGKWQQLAALLTLPNHHGWKSELEGPQESPRSKDPLVWMRRQSSKGWSLLFSVTWVSRRKVENTFQISRCQGSAYVDTLTCKVHIRKSHYLSFSEPRPHRGPEGL